MSEYYLPPLPAHWEHGVTEFVRSWGRAAIEADRKRTADLISVYQGKVRALEAENHSLVSDLDDRQARGEPINHDECRGDVFSHGVSIGLFDVPKETMNSICAGITAVTGAKVDWHYVGGRVHLKALPAPQPQSQARGEPVAPEGFRLIAVNETFDSLTFWLDRCEQKGHLENCADLVEPWEAFEYREVEAPQPAEPSGGESVAWEMFPGYLIEQCEGEIITEEGLQRALADMLGDPEYTPQPQTPAKDIPEGYKLVPVEPTEEMLNAARDWSDKKYGKPIGNDAAVGCFQAMLEAAPEDQ